MTGPGRRLISVPILHAGTDMGALREGLQAVYTRAFGRRGWEEHVAVIDRFWQAVRRKLHELELQWTRVDLYQDGLPICGKELQIAEQTAAKGSENYQLLMDLVERGARLIGTEDPELLLAEYRLVKAELASGSEAGPSGPQPVTAAEILAKRDAFIARRVDATLVPGRTGVLLLGVMHQVEKHLPEDVAVTDLHVEPAQEGPRRTGAGPGKETE